MRLLALCQLLLAVRVLPRLVRRPDRLRLTEGAPGGRVAVVLPVLDEEARLAGCLKTLLDQDPAVAEILVVDGGSTDRTLDVARRLGSGRRRFRFLDASPVPAGWNGKAWGLEVGASAAGEALDLSSTRPRGMGPDLSSPRSRGMGPELSSPRSRGEVGVGSSSDWLLTVDADTRLTPGAAEALVAAAEGKGLDALSVPARQEVPGRALAALHPALLTTLVYRLGAPGRTFSRPDQVQASGQCFLVRRAALERIGGFSRVRSSRCEDVTVARELVAAGFRVGFYELDGLVRVRMYEDWRQAWRGWPRSLPLRDRFWGWSARLGLLEVALVQALPLPLVLLAAARRRRLPLAVNASLLALRLGVLVGTRRAYAGSAWTYWLSPLLDVPAAAALNLSLIRRRHLWRGRLMVDDRT